jgi:hypothetical protein
MLKLKSPVLNIIKTTLKLIEGKENNMSKYSTLLVPILEQILVKEIGEANIPPLAWKKMSPTKYKFLVDINDFTEVVTVDFERIEDEGSKQFYFPPKYQSLENVYNVGYLVGRSESQYTTTDLKTLLTILSTVVDIIKNFLNEVNPDGLFIKGSEKELGSGDISQKSNLYQAFLKKGIDSTPGYTSDGYRDGNFVIKTKS